jgi:hypothetical protein
MKMITVYRLQDDTERVQQIQKATLTTPNFGIQQTHGLLGSSDWWNNIEVSKLPVHTLRGVISRVYMGSMGDWPTFQITADDGNTESFTRECHSKEQDAEFLEGRRVEIDYVWQQLRSIEAVSPSVKIILEIRIQET